MADDPNFQPALYCKDCTFHEAQGEVHLCHAPPARGVVYATDEREPGGLCGPRGTLWQPVVVQP
jgi:hypothetical protein